MASSSNNCNQNSASDESVGAEAAATVVNWVSAIADNLKNPVAGIGAALDLVTQELATHRATGEFNESLVDNGIEKIRQRLKSLDDYVSELINFARPAAIDPRQVSVTDIYEAVLADVRPKLPNGTKITLEIEDRLARSIYADAEKFAFALRALITNAVEAFGSSGLPRVLISAERNQGTALTGTVVTVEDNGPGFAENVRRRALEPFFSTRDAGTGLGLAIVRKYVEAHGGKLTIGSSKSLGGAAVSLFFPDQGA